MFYQQLTYSCLVVSLQLSRTVTCKEYNNDKCRVQFNKNEEKQSYSYYMSCHCNTDPGLDVSESLRVLVNNSWKLRMPEGKQLEETSLELIKCNFVEKDTREVMKTLRNSKMLKLNIINGNITLKSNAITSNYSSMAIIASFLRSNLPTLGTGLFTNASYVDLKLEDCSIGVIEAGFLINYLPKAEVRATLTGTNISTIAEEAFALPVNSIVIMEKGYVGQWEKYSYRGGTNLELREMKIESFQEWALNIYGMKKLAIKNSECNRMRKNVIFSSITARNQRQLDVNKQEPLSEITISNNNFGFLHNEAFSRLCDERKLNFSENNILNVNPRPVLMSESCSKKRNWGNDVKNNFINCQGCINHTTFDEQICAFFNTAYCLNTQISQVRTVIHTTTAYHNEQSLHGHLKQECPSKSAELIHQCNLMMKEGSSVDSSPVVYNIINGAMMPYLDLNIIIYLHIVNVFIPLLFL